MHFDNCEQIGQKIFGNIFHENMHNFGILSRSLIGKSHHSVQQLSFFFKGNANKAVVKNFNIKQNRF